MNREVSIMERIPNFVWDSLEHLLRVWMISEGQKKREAQTLRRDDEKYVNTSKDSQSLVDCRNVELRADFCDC